MRMKRPASRASRPRKRSWISSASAISHLADREASQELEQVLVRDENAGAELAGRKLTAGDQVVDHCTTERQGLGGLGGAVSQAGEECLDLRGGRFGV